MVLSKVPSMIERNPRAPVLRSVAGLAMADSASNPCGPARECGKGATHIIWFASKG
jgi:hypothetical protein